MDYTAKETFNAWILLVHLEYISDYSIIQNIDISNNGKQKKKIYSTVKYNIYRFWGHMLLLNISKIGHGYFSNVTKWRHNTISSHPLGH